MPGVLMQRQKAVSIILLGILLAGFTVACGKPDDTTDGESLKNENVLRYDVNNPFASLNPATTRFSGSNHIFPLLYSYLFVPNADGKLEPDLATRWYFDPETLQWTIHLRNDALFHNNRKVTSKDVKFSLENRLKNIHPDLYSVIDRISLLSDTVLRIQLNKEDPLILKKIWDYEVFLHPEAEEIDYYHHPIGSGPFKFKYRETNKMVVLEANDDYYNDRPSLDKIVFYYQPDKEKAWTRLLAGKTDIAQEISPKNYQMMKKYEKRYYFDHYILRYYTILLYNTFDPLFADSKVRLALAHGIDREHIVKNILKGYGRVANGPMGVDSPFHNPEVKPVPFDPQKALSLLKEAGWTSDEKGGYLYKEEKPFEFNMLVFKESQVEKEVARYIQLCLNELNIQVRLQALSFEELKKRYFRNTEFQAVLTDLAGAYRNPELIKTQWSPDIHGKAYVGKFEHPELTLLIQKAVTENELYKQKMLFYAVDALMKSLQPGTFLFHKTAIDVMSKRFHLPHRFSLTHEGIYHLKFVKLNHE